MLLISLIKFKDLSVRIKLLAMFLIMILLTVFFGLFVMVKEEQALLNGENARQVLLAQRTQKLESELRGLTLAANEIATKLNVQNGGWEEAELIKSLTDFSNTKGDVLAYVDLEGNLLANNKSWQEFHSGRFDITKNHFRFIFNEEKNLDNRLGFWTDVHRDEWLNKFVISYAAPVYKNRNLFGLVIFVSNLDKVIETASSPNSGNTIKLFAFSESGEMLYHPDYGFKLLRQAVDVLGKSVESNIIRKPLTDYMLAISRGEKISSFNEWQQTVYASHQKLNVAPWYLVAYQTNKDIWQPYINVYQLFLVFTLFSIFIAAMYFQWIFDQLFAKPINKLSQALSSEQEDNKDLIQLAKKENEIGDVAEVALNIHQRFQSQIAQLNEKLTDYESMAFEQKALAHAVSQSDYAVLLLSANFNIVYVDAKSLNLIGKDREEVMDSNFYTYIHPQMEFVKEQIDNEVRRKNKWLGELILRTGGDDKELWVNCSISPIRDNDGTVSRFAVSLHDISFIKDSQSKIEKLAYTDELTGLANRSFFLAQLEKLAEISKRGRYDFGLICFDLDDFKKVNDLHSHEGGDILLKEFSQRISCEVRNEDVLARIGGDEFAMIVGGVKSEQDVLLKVNKIISAASDVFIINEQAVTCSASVGITMSSTDENDPELLMQHADLAMYEAKSLGKNTYHFYTQELNDMTRHRLKIEGALKAAIKNDELNLHFQPKVDSRNSQLVGFEALLRWINEELGFVSPAEFVPIAEQSGLILDIGTWVIDKSAEFVASMESPKRVSINISARQFEVGKVSLDLQNAIAKYAIDPSFLEVEITESSLMVDVEDAIRQLYEIKNLGVNIAIDDFGTGYSSLSYLKRFPVKTLKVDRSFIKDIPEDNNDMEITAAIIAIAQKLGMEVIAEGAETQDQIDFLAKNGCYLIQGYFYSKPLPANEARTFSLDN